jgi:hypothetical protein
MFVLGHLGFGSVLARPWRATVSRWPLLAGMLVPDLIDKPLYYARLSDVFSCTRTVGHTALLVAAVLIVGVMTKRGAILAIGIGMATHILLDCAMDLALRSPDSSAIHAALFPFLGPQFARVYLPSVSVHIERLANLPILLTEVTGAALLAWELRSWLPRRSS